MIYKHIPFQSRLNFAWLRGTFNSFSSIPTISPKRDTKTTGDCIETILKDLLRTPITVSDPAKIQNYIGQLSRISSQSDYLQGDLNSKTDLSYLGINCNDSWFVPYLTADNLMGGVCIYQDISKKHWIASIVRYPEGCTSFNDGEACFFFSDKYSSAISDENVGKVQTLESKENLDRALKAAINNDIVFAQVQEVIEGKSEKKQNSINHENSYAIAIGLIYSLLPEEIRANIDSKYTQTDDYSLMAQIKFYQVLEETIQDPNLHFENKEKFKTYLLDIEQKNQKYISNFKNATEHYKTFLEWTIKKPEDKIGILKSAVDELDKKDLSSAQRIIYFHQQLISGTKTLERKDRDSYLLSFLKGVGVGAAGLVGLIGFGIGSYYTTKKAYNCFFKKEEKEFQRFRQNTYSSRGPT